MKYPNDYYDFLEDKIQNIFFVDIETTGLDPYRNEILSLSLSVCDYKTLDQIDEIELKFKPENLNHWSKDAEEIHKIKLPLALEFPDKKESLRNLARFFIKYKSETVQPIVSHALNFKGYFDQKFLLANFEQVNYKYQYLKMVGMNRSTIDYAKSALTLKSYKLDVLCEHYGIKLDHHDAKSDRQACQSLYKIFRNL